MKLGHNPAPTEEFIYIWLGTEGIDLSTCEIDPEDAASVTEKFVCSRGHCVSYLSAETFVGPAILALGGHRLGGIGLWTDWLGILRESKLLHAIFRSHDPIVIFNV
jgi:hypothetical protein